MINFAIVTISLALLFYTIGVWAEKLSARLKSWHLIFFWAGFVSDTTGTVTMGLLSNRFVFDIHGVSGQIALILMLLHAIWATIVIVKNNEKLIINFHKLSLFVWLIWLIPYISGLIMHMK
jgi:uncharacterized repeat protein (TIGR03987 family)